MNRKFLFAALLPLLPGLGQCIPLVVFDNTAGTRSSGFYTVAGPSATGQIQSPRRLAMQFTTGGQASTLQQVDAVFGYRDGSADSTGTDFSLSIFTSASGLPGSALGGLTPPPNLPEGSLSTATSLFLPTSTISLLANTTYWVVAEAFNDAIYGWADTSTASPHTVRSFAFGPWDTILHEGAMKVTVDTLDAAGTPELDTTSWSLPFLFLTGLLALRPKRHQEI